MEPEITNPESIAKITLMELWGVDLFWGCMDDEAGYMLWVSPRDLHGNELVATYFTGQTPDDCIRGAFDYSHGVKEWI